MRFNGKGFVRNILKSAGVTTLAFAIVGIYLLIALNMDIFNPIAKAVNDYSFEDVFYRIMDVGGKKDTSRIVTIVDMTELQTRAELAQVLTDISSLKPKVLGVDIVFEGHKDPVVDSMLADAARKSHGIFAYKIIDRTDESVHSFFMPCDSLKEAFVNMPRKLYGGLKRSLHIGRVHEGKLCPSIMKVVADSYMEEEIIPLADEELRINFSPMVFEVVNYADVLQNEDLIKDRIVLLGAMKEENDMHYTPQGKMAGTELLAYGVETVLKHNRLKVVEGWAVFLISFLVVMLIVLIRARYLAFADRRHPLLRAVLRMELLVGLVLFSLIAIIVWVEFELFLEYNVSINLTYAIAAVAFIYTANNLYETIKELITRKKSS